MPKESIGPKLIALKKSPLICTTCPAFRSWTFLYNSRCLISLCFFLLYRDYEASLIALIAVALLVDEFKDIIFLQRLGVDVRPIVLGNVNERTRIRFYQLSRHIITGTTTQLNL